MAELRYPRALFYKEWHQKRFAALLVFLLICPSVYIQTLIQPLWVHGTNDYQYTLGHQTPVDVISLRFSDFCNQVVGHYTIGLWASIVVGTLAVYSVWVERHNDTFWFTLSGPISKSAVLRVKYTVDAGIVLGVFTVLAASLVIIDWIVGANYPVAGMIRWWFAEIGIQMGIYALVFMLTVLVGNVVAACLLAFGVAMAPMYVGALMVNLLGANLIYFERHAPVPLSWKIMWIISHLSPLNWFNEPLATSWGPPWVYFAWFLVFSVICCFLAQFLFEKAENERISNLFVFRESRHIVMLLLSCAGSFLLVRTIFHSYAQVHMHELVWYSTITIVLWIIATIGYSGLRVLRIK